MRHFASAVNKSKASHCTAGNDISEQTLDSQTSQAFLSETTEGTFLENYNFTFDFQAKKPL